MPGTDFVYVADPMCSWCWGFAPVMKAFRERYPNAFEYRLVLGGLRAGRSATPLDDQMKSYIAHHWRESLESIFPAGSSHSQPPAT